MTDRPPSPDVAPRADRRSTFALAGALALCVVALAILALVWPPDGQARGGDGWRFAGRLHPMLVHLPIGLLLLVPALELGGLARRFRHLRATAGVVLALGAIAATVAAAHGYVLARFDGVGGTNLTWHLWAGATTALLAAIAVALRAISPTAYVASLVALVGALSFAGHLGGQLTYGATYLSEVAPRPIARWLGPVEARASPADNRAELAASPATPDEPTSLPSLPSTRERPPLVLKVEPATLPTTAASTDGPVTFAGTIAPMFAESCVSCHGPAKVKGGLRLDSYAALIAGGESGPELIAGDPAGSDLYHRMKLPATDDDAMPPAGARHRPTTAQVEAVRRWIADGANG